MKKIVFLGLLCLVNSTLFAQSASDKVLGIWMTVAKNAKIEIYRSDNRYFGKVLWGTLLYEKDGKTSLKDNLNPDPLLRSRNRIGLIFITDLIYSDGEYSSGQIYNSTNGKTYRLKMKLLDDNDLEMRGFLGFTLFGQTVKWVRVKE
ncbi:DUF2147 domain-containing protein [Mucilaginibacter endophyticus]|uniref:DUF2147 domain-containing protein n=1 Tax=Mucilaginibacter endophyticus TaxID=2675003 RepID=UPI000E0D97BB|nr:DUF2147 domain-containing protein [Mucilaginibacter endophyticus]